MPLVLTAMFSNALTISLDVGYWNSIIMGEGLRKQAPTELTMRKRQTYMRAYTQTKAGQENTCKCMCTDTPTQFKNAGNRQNQKGRAIWYGHLLSLKKSRCAKNLINVSIYNIGQHDPGCWDSGQRTWKIHVSNPDSGSMKNWMSNFMANYATKSLNRLWNFAQGKLVEQAEKWNDGMYRHSELNGRVIILNNLAAFLENFTFFQGAYRCMHIGRLHPPPGQKLDWKLWSACTP